MLSNIAIKCCKAIKISDKRIQSSIILATYSVNPTPHSEMCTVKRKSKWISHIEL